MKSGQSGFKMFGLVRDKDGNPKFDDINDIPIEIWDMLSEDEKADIQAQRRKLKRGK